MNPALLGAGSGDGGVRDAFHHEGAVGEGDGGRRLVVPLRLEAPESGAGTGGGGLGKMRGRRIGRNEGA